MSNTGKKKKTNKKFSIVMLVICCAVILSFVYSFIKTGAEIKRRKTELSDLRTECESISEENSELQSEVDNTDEAELARQNAQKNGYIKPGDNGYYFY